MEEDWISVMTITNADELLYHYNLPTIDGARLLVKYHTGTINEFVFWDIKLGFVDSLGLSYFLNNNVKFWKYYNKIKVL
jgi:hypothetical protein